MRLTILAGLVLATAAAGHLSRTEPTPAAARVEQARPRPAQRPSPVASRNPYEGNKAAIADGEKLFVQYNCADCHGGGGSGLMAPSLADHRWRYGGSVQEVYASITQGRPEGMPTWGPVIPTNQVWKLVAYVRSLGEGKDVSTQNFVARVQRTGH